jgi:hypothetical protein
MKRILTIIAFMAVICNCQSQDESAQDQECFQGGNYCQWQIGNRQASLCCPSVAPYCGAVNTNCEPGRCCSSIPLNLQLHPND